MLLQLVYILGGLGMALISIPLIQRWVKPNPFYGFRTPKTLHNETLWYEINSYSGKRLLLAGLLIALSGLLLSFVPGLSIDLYVLLVTLVVAVALGAALIQSFFYLNQITK